MKNQYTLQAFEVEDIHTRENFTFVYNPYHQSVEGYDTSRNVGKKLKFREVKDFPLESENAYEYYTKLYQKSLTIDLERPIVFLGFVHPVSIVPLAEMKKWKLEKEIINSNEIKAKLRRKHKEFYSSIKSFKIRKILRKHTYFSGGCVSDLIRGDTPRDYDLFFKNTKALKTVISYFVEKHNNTYSETNRNYMITTIESEDSIRLSLNKQYIPSDTENNDSMNPVLFSERAISFPKGFQLVIDSDNQDSKCYERFDFLHTMAAYLPYENKLVSSEETLNAINSKQLMYNAQGTNPVGSARRLLKFIKRGWEIGNQEHYNPLRRIRNIDDLSVEMLDQEYTW